MSEENGTDITKRLTRVIREQIGVKEEEILPGANLVNDLGCDSLDLVEIVMAMEEEFEIEIPDEEAERWTTVNDIEQYLVRRFAK